MENYGLENKFLGKITSLNRITKRIIMMLFDSICVVLVLIISFSIIKGFLYWPDDKLFWIIFGTPVLLQDAENWSEVGLVILEESFQF